MNHLSAGRDQTGFVSTGATSMRRFGTLNLLAAMSMCAAASVAHAQSPQVPSKTASSGQAGFSGEYDCWDGYCTAGHGYLWRKGNLYACYYTGRDHEIAFH